MRSTGAIRVTLLAIAFVPITAFSAPAGHIITGIGIDTGGLTSDRRFHTRDGYNAANARVGYQLTPKFGIQLQGDYWWLSLKNNLLYENAPDIHWHGWTSIACLTYAPRAGAFSLCGGAGIGHASFDGGYHTTGPAIRLGAAYSWSVSRDFALVPRADWQYQWSEAPPNGSPDQHDIDRLSVGIGLEWN